MRAHRKKRVATFLDRCSCSRLMRKSWLCPYELTTATASNLDHEIGASDAGVTPTVVLVGGGHAKNSACAHPHTSGIVEIGGRTYCVFTTSTQVAPAVLRHRSRF